MTHFLSVMIVSIFYLFFFFKQKTAYEMRISDWSSDVCSSDLSFKAVLVSFANQLDLDKFKISAITGYTTWENFAYGNFDETSYSQLQTYTNMTYTIFSPELRVMTDFEGPFHGLVGGFSSSDNVDQTVTQSFRLSVSPYG